jgi:hypothetical protein
MLAQGQLKASSALAVLPQNAPLRCRLVYECVLWIAEYA